MPAPQENNFSATPTVYENSRRSASDEGTQQKRVDVQEAERDFAALQREYTRQSQKGVPDAEKQVRSLWRSRNQCRRSDLLLARTMSGICKTICGRLRRNRARPVSGIRCISM
jgi:hypothetical protein